MGSRSKQRSEDRGAFGKKHFAYAPAYERREISPEERALRKKGALPFAIPEFVQVGMALAGVVRPSRGRLRTRVKFARRGHRQVNINAMRATKDEPKAKPKRARGFFGFTKSIFQRKGE